MKITIIVTRTRSGRLLFNDSDFVMIMTISIIEKNMMRKMFNDEACMIKMMMMWLESYDYDDNDYFRKEHDEAVYLIS